MVLFINLKDLIAAYFTMLLVMVLVVIFWRQARRQKRCKHANYHETSACDAVCNDCGKNLGFIGRIRDNDAHG